MPFKKLHSPNPQKRGRKTVEETGRILSIREEQVLRHLNKGLRYAEIAAVLCISPATVKAHCHKIYKRLGARNKEEAVYKYFDKK